MTRSRITAALALLALAAGACALTGGELTVEPPAS
jgi:hypothetical protein